MWPLFPCSSLLSSSCSLDMRVVFSPRGRTVNPRLGRPGGAAQRPSLCVKYRPRALVRGGHSMEPGEQPPERPPEERAAPREAAEEVNGYYCAPPARPTHAPPTFLGRLYSSEARGCTECRLQARPRPLLPRPSRRRPGPPASSPPPSLPLTWTGGSRPSASVRAAATSFCNRAVFASQGRGLLC